MCLTVPNFRNWNITAIWQLLKQNLIYQLHDPLLLMRINSFSKLKIHAESCIPELKGRFDFVMENVILCAHIRKNCFIQFRIASFLVSVSTLDDEKYIDFSFLFNLYKRYIDNTYKLENPEKIPYKYNVTEIEKIL